MTYVVAIGGHTGTGKTTLAYGLRRKLRFLEKAVVVEDDQVRRELLAVDLAHTLTEADYAPEVSAKVVEEIKARTKGALTRGLSVINSSGFFAESSRQAVQQGAEDLHVKFVGIWLIAPTEVMKERVAKRMSERETLKVLSLDQGHASDADEGVIDKYGDIGLPESKAWIIVDASASAPEILEQVSAFILKQ